jgi:hypothetical protein
MKFGKNGYKMKIFNIDVDDIYKVVAYRWKDHNHRPIIRLEYYYHDGSMESSVHIDIPNKQYEEIEKWDV